jgi:hypothetical protein
MMTQGQRTKEHREKYLISQTRNWRLAFVTAATGKVYEVPMIGKTLHKEQETIYKGREYVQCSQAGRAAKGVATVNVVGGDYLQ